MLWRPRPWAASRRPANKTYCLPCRVIRNSSRSCGVYSTEDVSSVIVVSLLSSLVCVEARDLVGDIAAVVAEEGWRRVHDGCGDMPTKVVKSAPVPDAYPPTHQPKDEAN